MPSFKINRIIRRCRLLVIFIGVIAFGLKFIHVLYYNSQCNNNILKLKETICDQHRDGKLIGTFCTDLCSIYSSSFIKFRTCPNFFGHNGKEIVLSIEWKKDFYILKGRSFHEDDMVAGSDSGSSKMLPTVKELQIQQQHYVQALHNLINVTFGGPGTFQVSKEHAGSRWPTHQWQTDVYTANNLLPFEFNGNISLLNSTALRNTYLLSQDNEYVLSQSLFKSHPPDLQVFPKVLSTCGHFYVVEFCDEILDLSYMSPTSLTSLPFLGSLIYTIIGDNSSPVTSRTLLEKVNTAVRLTKFLSRLVSINSGLELCDVKFEHFGLYWSTNAETDPMLLMIDSDMIYHRNVARENIRVIGGCENDRDCDFIDCQGVCKPANVTKKTPMGWFKTMVTDIGQPKMECEYDLSDNNLKRICRNMFFMGNIAWSQMGLLPELESSFGSEINSIKTVCNMNTSDVTRDMVDFVFYFLERIRNKLVN